MSSLQSDLEGAQKRPPAEPSKEKERTQGAAPEVERSKEVENALREEIEKLQGELYQTLAQLLV